MDLLKLVQHPDHVLRVGHYVGRGHVGNGANILCDLTHPAAANLFLLALAQIVRIANDSAFGSSQRDIDDGTLPGHPHGQSADRVDRLLRVKANAAFARPAGVVVLNAEAAKDLDASVIHACRNCEVELAQGITQQFAGRRVQSQILGYLIELGLCDLERIKSFGRPLRKVGQEQLSKPPFRR